MYNFKVQLGEAEKVIKELRAEKEVSDAFIINMKKNYKELKMENEKLKHRISILQNKIPSAASTKANDKAQEFRRSLGNLKSNKIETSISTKPHSTPITSIKVTTKTASVQKKKRAQSMCFPRILSPVKTRRRTMMQLLDAPSIYPGTTAKNFKCEKCDNQYVYQTGLNKHMLNKHVK